MIVSILAFGSRGDVQPLAALAAAIAARGHEARLLAPDVFSDLAGRGVDFRPLGFDILTDHESEAARRFFAADGNPISSMLALARYLKVIADRAPRIRDDTKGSDVIVGSGFAASFAAMAAQYWKIPSVQTWLQPAVASRQIPYPFTKPTRFAMPGWANLAMSLGAEQSLWLIQRAAGRPVRDLYRLPPAGLRPALRAAVRSGETVLLAYSETLLPRCRDWPENVEVTGYWFLDRPADWTPPPSLERFIESGPPPVYVGFGSMKLVDPRATLDAVLKAVAMNGARAVITAGWGGLRAESLPEFAVGVDAAPHDWLFPRMAAIVHHGGTGTTGAALRAGKPSVIVPFITDQFFWARQLKERGLAPAAAPHSRLTAETLAAAIGVALNDPRLRGRAAGCRRARSRGGRGRPRDRCHRAGGEAALQLDGTSSAPTGIGGIFPRPRPWSNSIRFRLFFPDKGEKGANGVLSA